MCTYYLAKEATQRYLFKLKRAKNMIFREACITRIIKEMMTIKVKVAVISPGRGRREQQVCKLGIFEEAENINVCF
jgi:hypothetical protein